MSMKHFAITSIDGGRQMDDSLIPASECKCRADWNKIGFFVCFALDCPIDEHAMKARQGDFDETT